MTDELETPADEGYLDDGTVEHGDGDEETFEAVEEPLNEPEDESEDEPEDGLYPGDSGELSLDARRVLVQLLAGPSLEGRRHSKLWPVLIREEEAIRRRLSELFLQLVIDRDLQAAFTRQADTGELEVPRLLRRANLTLLESILLLDFRGRLTQAESHGDRALVSTGEIVELLGVYDRSGNTDRALFEKRVYAAVEKMKKHNILRRIRHGEGRFEISPTLKLLFSAEKIQALTRVYKAMGAEDEAGTAIGETNTTRTKAEEAV